MEDQVEVMVFEEDEVEGREIEAVGFILQKGYVLVI